MSGLGSSDSRCHSTIEELHIEHHLDSGNAELGISVCKIDEL